MILYFDSYITDIPLYKSYVEPNKKIRSSCKNYTMPSKIDIAKYTLASYAIYPWSNVLIKYSLDEGEDYQLFDSYVKELFPKAIIVHGRSDNQKKFKESWDIIDKFDDDWIFYAANNDHPMITSNISIINQVLEKAKELSLKHDFVSILYSHFSEFINAANFNSLLNSVFGKDIRTIYEDENVISIIKKDGFYSGIQIINKKLFYHWFCSKDLGEKRIIRPEGLDWKTLTRNQVIVIPKQEICAHFDGYSHTIGELHEIRPEQVPPLFVPSGFFENQIRIKYGYNQYYEGWTNINPAAKKFSFKDNQHGTDLKISIDNIPLFWKGHIQEIDTNENIDMDKIEKGKQRYLSILKNPYKFSNKPLDFHTLIFYLILPIKILLELMKESAKILLLLIGNKKMFSIAKKIYSFINVRLYKNRN